MNRCLQQLIIETLCLVEMLQLLPLLSVVICTPLDKSHSIGSQLLTFLQEDADSQIVNSTVVLKKKLHFNQPADREKGPLIPTNRRLDAVGVVWKHPLKPTHSFSNHQGSLLDSKQFQKRPPITSSSKPYWLKEIVNNHNTAQPIRRRPQVSQASSWVSVIGSAAAPPTTDVIGSRLKPPDTIYSAALQVKDAPKNLRTTIKHNKIIVIDKRIEHSLNLLETDQQAETTNSFHGISEPDRKNFSVAAVMDHWSHIPIPSSGSWGQASSPVKGISRPIIPAQTVVPNIPFMPLLSSLISPLLSKPLTPSAVTSGMQGIKAMQGFLRNSLMGAMFCFLPSAFIALSLTATQRAQLRKIPEIDNMLFFCKKCIENLKDVKELQSLNELKWLKENLE